KERKPVTKLTVGDLGATLKLKHSETNDTLAQEGFDLEIKPIQYPQPRIRRAVYAVNTKDEEKLTDSLKKIHSQDPTVQLSFSNETRQLILACQGELHLATIDWTVKNIYGVEALFEKPKISFRETIQR